MKRSTNWFLLILINILLVVAIAYLVCFRYDKLSSLKNVLFYIGIFILAICDAIVTRLLKAEKYFVFIPLSDEELSKVGMNSGDILTNLEYKCNSEETYLYIALNNSYLQAKKLSLDSDHKCEILSKSDFSDFSKNNKGLCILIQDKSNVEALKKACKLKVSSLKVKDGSLSLTYQATTTVKSRQDLKLWLSGSTVNDSSGCCNVYKELLQFMFTTLEDTQPICPEVDRDGKPINKQGIEYWIDSCYGNITLLLLKMFNFKEMLNREELLSLEEDFREKVECILNYINQSKLTETEGNFYQMLRILCIFSHDLYYGSNCTYQFLDYEVLEEANYPMFKEKICKDLDIELNKYILAIACYQGHEMNEKNEVTGDCPVRTNSQIKKLLDAQHKDTVETVHKILNTYSDKKIIRGSEDCKRLKVFDILREQEEIETMKDAYSVEELVTIARELVSNKYCSIILSSYFPHEYITKQVDDMGFAFNKSITEKVECKNITLVDGSIPDTTVDHVGDIILSDICSRIKEV
ncbi:hypothetical protein K6025_02790 [Ehrlichia sp. JZT12]